MQRQSGRHSASRLRTRQTRLLRRMEWPFAHQSRRPAKGVRHSLPPRAGRPPRPTRFAILFLLKWICRSDVAWARRTVDLPTRSCQSAMDSPQIAPRAILPMGSLNRPPWIPPAQYFQVRTMHRNRNAADLLMRHRQLPKLLRHRILCAIRWPPCPTHHLPARRGVERPHPAVHEPQLAPLACTSTLTRRSSSRCRPVGSLRNR